MTITQMRFELLELGYPVENFSDAKVIRIYPRAKAFWDDIYNEMISRDCLVNDISQEMILRNFKMIVDLEWPICQKMPYIGLYSNNTGHPSRESCNCQQESQ